MFEKFVELVETLRSENGCPWDRLQTFKTLVPLFLEETYELLDAVERGDIPHIKEELGDILLHIVMFSTIAKEKGYFTIEEVIDDIKSKIIARHPHVFGNIEINSPKEVLNNWEKIKLSERYKNGGSLLSGVPNNLPALLAAQRIQEKVARVGFDWENIEDIFKKLEEELGELKKEIGSNATDRLEEELGDTLFVLANIARKLEINAELSLRKTNRKFINRFSYVEKRCEAEGLVQPTLEQMDQFWNEIKRKEDNNNTKNEENRQTSYK